MPQDHLSKSIIMSIANVLGYVAGVCTTFSGLPQIIHCYRSKSTKDLSFISLGMTETGVVLWAVYGGLHKDGPIILWNVVSFILCTTLISMKVIYERHRTEELQRLQLTSSA